MKPILSPGDQVSVGQTLKGFYRGRYLATVIRWTSSGQLRVKSRETGKEKVISAQNVNKVTDSPTGV
ncbi:hypothetical protein GO755_40120 [Spirosoma sp. HMF4905]|uniref:DUF1918 domain-containing protein n=1 Tax=Spirosoma arboris TaxID=2682092 RepID=A0A7K1SRF9_9BACT|nr:hypothetical protein [Spirosoma arboris]MVM36283.1 hypothetical protein [Spirosoma arboris]